MNQARAPASDEEKRKVLKAYRKGAGPKELSEKFGFSVNTIKSWIRRDKERSEKGAPSKNKDAPKKGKPGAPLGSRNAAGNRGGPGGPKRNQKAVKHGAYRGVFFDFLDADDKALVDAMGEVDVEDHLLMEIQTLTIRERRVLKAIEEQKKVKSRVYVASIDKTDTRRTFEGSEEEQAYQKEAYEEYRKDHKMAPGYQTQITTRTEATIDLISRLDRELTSIQRQITANLKLLEEVRQARIENIRADELLPLQKERIDAEIERLDAQTSKILGTNLELEDTTEADELLYGSGMEVTADASEAPDPEE